jgi:DNA (cytosine-5)-methyltransferase 1
MQPVRPAQSAAVLVRRLPEACVNRPPVLRLHSEELIVDSFAGGGGASVGIEWATGRSPDIAINHDPQAVAMHAANHPATKHLTEDVWKIDPVKVCGGRPVGLAWFSPDCKHFSKAKGGKPVDKKIRGLAWIVVKWAKLVKPRVICLENVEEFKDWGPLGEDNRPDKLRKGLTFQRWKAQLENLGYRVELRELVAADYGAPTTRKRLFLVGRCDGQPIRWPQQTHEQHGRAGLPKWRAAAECIDWALPCHSIFLTPEEAKPLGIRRPLADNTMRRIYRGLMKFVIENPRPFIVPYYGLKGNETLAHSLDEPLKTQTGNPTFSLIAPHVAKFRGDSRGSDIEAPLPTVTAGPAENPAGAAHAMALVSAGIVPLTHQGAERNESTDEPMRTITGANRGEKALATAYVTRIGQTGGNGDYVNSPEQPLGAVVSKNEHLLVSPVIVRTAHGERDASGKKRGKGEHDPAAPLPTQTASPDFAVATAYLAGVGGRKGQSPETGVEQPYHTITAKADTVVVAPIMVPRYGEDPDPTRNGGLGQAPRAMSVEKPMPTIVPTQNGAQLVAATMVVSGYGEREGQAPRAQDIEKPLGTVVAAGKHAAVMAFLAKHFGGHETPGSALPDAMDTVTARDHHALVASFGVKLKGTSPHGQQYNLPLHTVQAEGNHHAAAQAFMLRYYGLNDANAADEPLRTITAADRFGLVMVHGEPHVIVDIGMRMLVPPELYRAQGFPSTYKINVIYKGKPLPKDAQVRMCGNSVSPYPCAALVLAQFADADEAVAA